MCAVTGLSAPAGPDDTAEAALIRLVAMSELQVRPVVCYFVAADPSGRRLPHVLLYPRSPLTLLPKGV